MPAIHLTQQTCERLASAFGSEPFTLVQAATAGPNPDQLRAAYQSGKLIRLRRGVLVVAEPMRAANPEGRHLLMARAAQLTIPVAIASAGTALLGHGLPSARPGDRIPPRPVLTQPRGGGMRKDVLLLRGHIEPIDICCIGALRVTGLARTAVDSARGKPLPEALVILDAALRRLAIGRRGHERGLRADEPAVCLAWEELVAAAHRSGVHGRAAVLIAIAHAAVLSESPAESWSRGVMILAHLGVPTLQHEVAMPNGRCYRCDFAWLQARLIGECDGMVKYDNIDAVRAEKHRQDDLHRAGWRVVRWTWQEVVKTPDVVIARLTSALADS